MTDLPAPLSPPHCDLRGYGYMPLFGHKLFSSALYVENNDAEFRLAIRIWWSAWNQVPAGSLPASDSALALLSDYGRNLKGWAQVREKVLRGFVKCSDGRLYHPLLCEAAVHAFGLRLKSDKKRAKDRKRLQEWRDRHPKNRPDPDDDTGIDDKVPPHPGRDVTEDDRPDDTCSNTGVDTGTDMEDERVSTPAMKRVSAEGEVKVKPSSLRSEGSEAAPLTRAASKDPAPTPALPRSARDIVWQDGLAIVSHLTGKSQGQCRSQIGKWLGELQDDCPRLMQVLQEAQLNTPIDPMAWITRSVSNSSGKRSGGGGRLLPERPSRLGWTADLIRNPTLHLEDQQ
ncbi:MAG: hypothetical protein ACRYGG_07740 [Janthinobacterium lividum]